MRQKPFRSFEDLERAMKNSTVPFLSPEQLCQRITSEVTTTDRMRISIIKKISVVTLALCLIMITSTSIYAVYNGWKLHNEDGEVVLEYTQLPQEQMDKDKQARMIYNRYQRQMEAIEESLLPGELLWFLIVEAYEVDRYYNPIQKEAEFTDSVQMKQATTTNFKTPTYIPQDLSLTKGFIRYKEDYNGIDIESLYKEAKDAGKAYIVKEGRLTEEATSVRLHYGNDLNPQILQLVITKSSGFIASSNASQEQMEVLQIDGIEALYNDKRKMLKMVLEENDTKYVYSLYGSQPQKSLSKEELINVAKSLIQ